MKPELVEIRFPNVWNAEKIFFLMVNHSSEEDWGWKIFQMWFKSYSNPSLLCYKEKKRPFCAELSFSLSLHLARCFAILHLRGEGEESEQQAPLCGTEILPPPGWNHFKLTSSHLTSIDRVLLSISHCHADKIKGSLSLWPDIFNLRPNLLKGIALRPVDWHLLDVRRWVSSVLLAKTQLPKRYWIKCVF